MAPVGQPGQIIILNGPPRSGKSSSSEAIQDTFEGVWMSLGVDRFEQMTPDRYQPGIGLRPDGERADLEPLVVVLYRAMCEAIGAHSRLGLNMVVDVGHDDAYSVPRGILPIRAVPDHRPRVGARPRAQEAELIAQAKPYLRPKNTSADQSSRQTCLVTRLLPKKGCPLAHRPGQTRRA